MDAIGTAVLRIEARPPMPAAQRIALWRDVMSGSGLTAFPDEATFEGSLTSQAIGELRTMRIDAATFRFTRDRALAARAARNHVLVNLVETGSFRGRLAGRMVAAGPGDVVLSRLGDTMDVTVEAACWRALMLPCAMVERHMRWPSRLNSSVHPAGGVAAAMLGGLVIALGSMAHTHSAVEAKRAAASTFALMATCLDLGAPGQAAAVADDPEDRDAQARAIRRYIADRLGDPELSAATVGDAFGLSRSGLYRTMGDTGDIAGMIRRLRLHAIRRDLLSPAHSERSLAAIARRWGMPDARTFRRAFVREFGCAPSALRDGSGAATIPGPIGTDMRRWFLGL